MTVAVPQMPEFIFEGTPETRQKKVADAAVVTIETEYRRIRPRAGGRQDHRVVCERAISISL
jgi:hypothetical protein